MTIRARAPRSPAAGFTLIELLAVMLIIAILMTFLVPRIPAAFDRANVTACKANLRDIGQGLMEFHGKYRKWPPHGGVRFFASLLSGKVWETTESTAIKLTCPAVESGALVGIADLPEDQWFADIEVVDGSYSSYAGRDVKEYPLRKFPGSGKDALVADDNDGGGNHRTATVVLWGDLTVRELELVELQQEGLLSDVDEWIPVGPDSPVEALSKLSLD